MEKELFEKLIILLIITLSCANLVFSIYNFYTIRESTKATKEKIDDLESFKKYTKNEFQIDSSKLDSIIQEKLEVFKKNITNELELYSFNLSNIIQEKMDESEVFKTNITNKLQDFKTNITNELQLSSSKILKIKSGTFDFGWEITSYYYLHKSKYAKTTHTFSIDFPESYSNIPKVHATLIMFDFSNTENTRVGLNVKNITEKGFKVELYTWANSRVFQGEISWLSYGI